MLTFIRKIGRSLIESGSVQKYLLYAIGEITLVVIGILIALQVNNWNVDRNLRKQEASILNEIERNIETNMEEIEKDILSIAETMDSMDVISDAMINDLPYDDSLAPHFGRINRYRFFNGVATGYQSLKTSGADIIPQAELRYDLIYYFDHTLAGLEYPMEELKDHYHKYVLDYFRLYFEIDPTERYWGATNPKPKDFAILKKDDTFISSIHLFKTVHLSVLRSLQNSKEDSEEILAKFMKYQEDNNYQRRRFVSRNYIYSNHISIS
jgi:hypothetical protein